MSTIWVCPVHGEVPDWEVTYDESHYDCGEHCILEEAISAFDQGENAHEG